MTEAEFLRAQIPASTDPERLERMAREAERRERGDGNMTTITPDDEREAREWLRDVSLIPTGAPLHKYVKPEHARTILALLDAPRMPKPGTIPLEVLDAMFNAASDNPPDSSIPDMAAAYRALYDHYTAPPKPQKAGAWGVLVKGHEHSYWCVSESKEACEYRASRAMSHDRYRIVRLVEDRDGE